MNGGPDISLNEYLISLADKFNVYPLIVDECVQEMAVAYLEGKQSEKELRQTCVEFGYYSKRLNPSSHFLENVSYVQLFDQSDNDFLLNFLAKSTEEGVISLQQAGYVYQWLLGDTDQMIADQFNEKRITIRWRRNKAIELLRDHFKSVG